MKPSLGDEIRALHIFFSAADVGAHDIRERAAALADKHVAEWQARCERLEALLVRFMAATEDYKRHTESELQRVIDATESTLQRAKEGM